MLLSCFSVFEGFPIPYPRREFLEDEEDEKADTGASKVCNRFCYSLILLSLGYSKVIYTCTCM